MRRRRGRVDPTGPRGTKLAKLALRTLERDAVARAGHHGLDITERE